MNAHEIHINDPDFADTVFTGGLAKREKYKFTPRAGYPSMKSSRWYRDPTADIGVDVGSVLAARDHDLHRMRRATLNPYFSKASVRKLESINRERVSTLLNRFETHRATGKVVSLGIIFRALTTDVIQQYSFGVSDNNLDLDDYNAPFYESVLAFFEGIHISIHCAWFGPLVNSLPQSLITALAPPLGGLFRMRKVRNRILLGRI